MTVALERNDGTTVSRSERVEQIMWPKESQKSFRQRVRAKALTTLNSVLGVRDGVRLTSRTGVRSFEKE